MCIGVEYYIFTQKEDRLVYAKYLDLYGNITEYDENEKTTFSYSEKPLINTLRPGAYVGKLSEEKYSFKLNIWVDNNGIASVYYNMDINYTGDEESGEGLDLRREYVMLDYEVDNDNICITIDEYSELTATIKNGNIIINNFIDFTNGTSLSNEIECKYQGSSLNYFFNH